MSLDMLEMPRNHFRDTAIRARSYEDEDHAAALSACVPADMRRTPAADVVRRCPQIHGIGYDSSRPVEWISALMLSAGHFAGSQQQANSTAGQACAVLLVMHLRAFPRPKYDDRHEGSQNRFAAAVARNIFLWQAGVSECSGRNEMFVTMWSCILGEQRPCLWCTPLPDGMKAYPPCGDFKSVCRHLLKKRQAEHQPVCSIFVLPVQVQM